MTQKTKSLHTSAQPNSATCSSYFNNLYVGTVLLVTTKRKARGAIALKKNQLKPIDKTSKTI